MSDVLTAEERKLVQLVRDFDQRFPDDEGTAQHERLLAIIDRLCERLIDARSVNDALNEYLEAEITRLRERRRSETWRPTYQHGEREETTYGE